ncbi:MAG: CoA-binding protein, partial [Actinomycetota bacterium]
MKAADPLEAMFGPRSVAVVGASRRPGSAGAVALQQLRAGGYKGPIYPVNPNYDEVAGLACYPELGALPGPADMAILALPNAALESQMAVAARSEVRSVVIFASGHETPPSGHGSLVERLANAARGAGIVVCGGNCMGFVDVERGLRALAFPERDDLKSGPITWLSHSGSAFTALLHNDRGLRFNLA